MMKHGKRLWFWALGILATFIVVIAGIELSDKEQRSRLLRSMKPKDKDQ